VRLDITGALRPVDVMLALPNRIDIGAGGVGAWGARPAGLARRATAALGLLSPGAMADDVTTLLPLVHPEWRWREIAGEEGLKAMRDAGLLEPVAGEETRRPAIERMRVLGRNAIAYALFRTTPGSGGPPDPGSPKHEKDLVNALNDAAAALKKITGYYAVPDDWAFRAQTLRLAEMEMWRLGLGAVVRKGRRELGLERGDKPKLPKGVLWVGEMRVESGAPLRWASYRMDASARWGAARSARGVGAFAFVDASFARLESRDTRSARMKALDTVKGAISRPS
jgi:hypothetical protein